MSSSASSAEVFGLPKRLLQPRHWPSWLGVWLIALLGRLPFPLLWLLGSLLGRLAYFLAATRRRVARINLRHCLPECGTWRREWILWAHFGWLGVAALTQGVSWNVSRTRLRRLVRIHGYQHIAAPLAAGRAVIVLVPHFVGLELGGAAFTGLVHPGVYMYQKIRNPVIDRRLRRARQQYGGIAIERHDDLRTLLRELRQGTPFFYLPDQDAGRRGIFAPFCGVAASTVPMLGRFAALSDALVIPAFARFRPWGLGLDLIFAPPLEGFPSGDPLQDATHMNASIEQRLREMPAQYFWVHRRFKTRPPGAAPLYPPRRRRNRNLESRR